MLIWSCTDDNSETGYEPGIYEPYKQEVSTPYAIADNKEIDGSRISLTNPLPNQNVGDIIFKESGLDDGIENFMMNSSIRLEKKNNARVYCPTCVDMPMQLHIKNDSLYLIPKNLNEALKYAPYSELGFVVVTGEEAQHHSTLRGKINDSGLVISTYDIFIKSTLVKRLTHYAYFLDLEYLKNVLKENDTLVYVKKETYFRKK